MRGRSLLVMAVALLGATAAAPVAQLPQRLAGTSGRTVTPVFEGWYPNADGSVSLSFGYFNRNAEETVEIPIGADNAVEPDGPNRGQPTRFEPGRHWGVFALVVPADRADPSAVWTLRHRGEEQAIPGHQRRNWHIDALAGEAGSGNTPPVLTFAEGGPEGAGPLGVTAGPLTATVGRPIDVVVWARDDGRPSGSVARAGRGGQPVVLTWFKHQGPGAVEFGTPSARVAAAGGTATTTVSFDRPGEYVIRVRANDASGVSGAGHAQCCWTNGFVKVTVSR